MSLQSLCRYATLIPIYDCQNIRKPCQTGVGLLRIDARKDKNLNFELTLKRQVLFRKVKLITTF